MPTGLPVVEKTAAFRQRRADDVRRCRARQARAAACYYVECDADTLVFKTIEDARPPATEPQSELSDLSERDRLKWN
jgi:hypothetical protein